MTDRAKTAVSLFSGAGGLDYGLMQAGFMPIVALDNDLDAVRTYETNFPQTKAIHADILDVSPADLRHRAGLSSSDSPDAVIGGPPCTPFSKSGFWLDWKREGLDPNYGMIEVFGRFVVTLRPRYFIFENVPTVASSSSPYRDSYGRLLRTLSGAGYQLDSAVIDASDLGVAQARRRLFLVGEYRPKVRGPRLELFGPRVRRTCRDALCDLPDIPEVGEGVSGKWAHLLPEVPPGDNYLFFTERRGHASPQFAWRSRYWSFLLKLDPGGVAPTIQARPGPSTGPFHWENRRLRVPELKRLFGYPDDFVFLGSRASIQRQIGNSVPPPVARAVGEALRTSNITLF